MSDLQDALDAWETRPTRDGVDDEALLIIVQEARKYANPDMEAVHKALYEWFHSERPMSSDVEKKLVYAALTVTEDE